MADAYASQIKQYEQTRKRLKELLRQAPSTVGAYAEPGSKAVNLDIALKNVEQQLKIAKGKQKEEVYYGAETVQPEEPKEGVVSKALRYLSTPLYATTGAVEAALGKGTEKGLLANIKANIKERGVMGDLLRSYGAPSYAAIPLGFILDVAADPINWATAGTSALIPRLGYGIAKAGVKGAGEAVASSALKKAATVGKYAPFFKKTAAYESLAEKTVKSWRSYNVLVGRDVKETIVKSLENPSWRQKAYRGAGLPWVEKILNKTPRGRKIVEAFKPMNWYSDSRYLDDMEKAQRAATGLGEIPKRVSAKGEEIAEVITGIKGKSSKNLLSIMTNGGTGKIDEIKNWTAKAIQEGAELASDRAHLAAASGPEEYVYRMAGEAMTDANYKAAVQEIVDRYYGGKTGSAKLDKLFNVFTEKFKVGNYKTGEDIVNVYGAYIGMFKSAKVPSGALNAIVGNLTFLPMSGINPINPNLMGKINNSRKMIWALMNKKPINKAFVNSILQDSKWAEELTNYPGTFRGIHGFDPKFLFGRAFADEKAREVADMLEGLAGIEGYASKIEKSLDIKGMAQAAKDSFASIPESMQGVASRLAGRGMTEAGMPGSQISYEIYRGGFNKFINKLSELEAKGSKGAKVLKWFYTRPMDYYETIDQSYKLGTALHFSQVGISERELLSLKRMMPSWNRPGGIDVSEIVEDAASGLYKLSPKLANEAVQDIFMNYGSLPAAIKVLRGLPFFGSPFASFAYFMAVKAGKTLKYNPDAFNKISFLMQEINGGKTPLEQKTLKEPYNQWYNQDGMVKLPFFKNTPVFLNLANMIGYYTMNMFQPSERRYDNDPKMKKLSAIWDKLPIGKTPEAQMVWDYFVQPLIIKNSNPLGMFDQPLYGTDASALTKYLAYPARTLTEAVVPSYLGAAGVATGLTVPQITDYIPEYRWRKLANAVQGMSSIGVPTKENSVQKTMRALSALMGLPVYTLETKYQTSK